MEGEKISIKNKALILSIALALFFVMGAAGAVNQTDVDVAHQAEVQEIHQKQTKVQIMTKTLSRDMNSP